jgi:hypothetical protein
MTKAFEAGSPQFVDDLDEDTIELELSPSDLLALSRPLEVRHAAAPPVQARLISAEPLSAEPAAVHPFLAEPAAADTYLAQRAAADGIAAEPAAGDPYLARRAAADPVLAEPAPASPFLAEQISAEPIVAKPISLKSISAEASSASQGSADEGSYPGDAPRINRWPLARITGALGIAAAVIALGSAAHRPTVQSPSASPVAVLKSTSSVAPAAPPAAAPAGLPVRFKNPFDASEVFEFPPGTSRADARQWVANVLMERARDRHPQLKSTKRVGGIRAARGRSAERTDLAANTARAAR